MAHEFELVEILKVCVYIYKADNPRTCLSNREVRQKRTVEERIMKEMSDQEVTHLEQIESQEFAPNGAQSWKRWHCQGNLQ
jgi:hypothetical protein